MTEREKASLAIEITIQLGDIVPANKFHSTMNLIWETLKKEIKDDN